MKVVILGAGRVGYNIARYLSTQNNDVTIVDHAEDVLQRVSETLDVQPVLGYASYPDVLQKAALEDVDLLIAVTGSDEVNIVACEVAHSLFRVKKKVARIRHQNYLNPAWSQLFSPNHLAVDHIISPEVEVARSISRSIRVTGAFDLIALTGTKLKLVGMRCAHPTSMLNTPLRLLPGQYPRLDFCITAVYRHNDLFIPSGDDKLLLGDEVYFVIPDDQVREMMEEFGYDDDKGHRLLIAGGGSIGLMLALELEEARYDFEVKIIERDPKRAQVIARQLKRSEVLCGDALDFDVLYEANVRDVETIVTVTQDDKVNILAALLARRNGADRTMALLNNTDYSPLVTSLGVDAVVSPHAITVSTILQHIRQDQIHGVHSLREGDLEVIEAEVQEMSNIVGLTVEDVNIKGQLLVCALRTSGKSIILPEKVPIRVGDHVVVVVRRDAVGKVERLFSVRPSYLY